MVNGKVELYSIYINRKVRSLNSDSRKCLTTYFSPKNFAVLDIGRPLVNIPQCMAAKPVLARRSVSPLYRSTGPPLPVYTPPTDRNFHGFPCARRYPGDVATPPCTPQSLAGILANIEPKKPQGGGRFGHFTFHGPSDVTRAPGLKVTNKRGVLMVVPLLEKDV